MKPAEKISAHPLVLILWTVAALLVPNVVLNITEPYTSPWQAANILIPAGFYLMAAAALRRTGLSVLLLFPFMFLGAFQLVLSYLYGESIIAVDMFLNVVTTNYTEAAELLSNIAVAIVFVIVLYVPVIACAVYFLCRKVKASGRLRRRTALCGAAAAICGGIIAACATDADSHPDCSFPRGIFPANVICNMAEAVRRTHQTADYPVTSRDFTFQARSAIPPGQREIYVYVIGETSRAINWQLGGYGRPTNPRLSERGNVVFFRRAISESNTTHKSVPMLLSHLDARSFNSITSVKSIITAMKEAGFYTRFFSNQARNHSYTEYFGEEADDTRYTDRSGTAVPTDCDLLPWVKEAAADTTHTKQFIVIHSYGSHFLYRDRYPQSEAFFLPDSHADATPSHRADLINAYDNTIRHTDRFLDSLIAAIDSCGCRSALLYSSDHGEDIFDDARDRFLHASPNPTYYQLHVAMLAWVSDTLVAHDPSAAEAMLRNSSRPVSPQRAMVPPVLRRAGGPPRRPA
ncbi:MAG: lipid A phosphoethanolamine transferase, partial [Muribaculaceae bacterium]|nr:lipid A phosphoethanolamine transferase [Muribaculaceae bacterium]